MRCPAGETQFLLNGTLRYIPPQRRFGHRQRNSELLVTDPESYGLWFGFGLDMLSPLRFLGPGPIILLGITVVTIGLFLLFLFVKYSPIFATYRLILRIFVGCVLIRPAISSSIEFVSPTPSPTYSPHTFAKSQNFGLSLSPSVCVVLCVSMPAVQQFSPTFPCSPPFLSSPSSSKFSVLFGRCPFFGHRINRGRGRNQSLE